MTATLPTPTPTAIHPASRVRLTILTGASRGLGLAMARQILLRPAPQVLLTVSRRPEDGADELLALAEAGGHRLESWALDLADAPAAAQRLAAWLAAQEPARFNRVDLINNAGVLPPLRSAADTDLAALSLALRVGLEAPLLLGAAFLRGTRGWPARASMASGGGIRLLNVSSGLARRGMAGSAAYCAAKAGLDNASRALALEEALQPHPAGVVSLAPGVVDTGMQVTMRAGAAAEFPDRERFVILQRNGLLATPDDAARRMLAWLDRADFGAEVIADARA